MGMQASWASPFTAFPGKEEGGRGDRGGERSNKPPRSSSDCTVNSPRQKRWGPNVDSRYLEAAGNGPFPFPETLQLRTPG